jgi:hypothetical protein
MRSAPAASRRLAASAAASAALLVAAPSARAQYTRTELPQSRFHLGPVGLTPRFALLNAGRDTNVYQRERATRDSSVVVRGSLQAATAFRQRLRLVADGWLDYGLYFHEKSETALDPGGELRAELDVSSFTFVGGAGALRARQRYSIDVDQRVRRDERFVSGGAEWRPTASLSLSGGAESRSYRYDPAVGTGDGPTPATVFDRDSLTGRLQLRYRLTALTTLVGSGDLLRDEYLHAPAGLATTRSYRYLAGFEFGERALLAGSLLVGLRDIPRSSAGTLPSYRGPAALAGLTLPILHYGRLIVTAQRDVLTSVSGASEAARNAYVLTGLDGTLEWALPLQLLARLNAGYDQARYLRPLPAAGDALQERLDRQYSYGGSLLRRIGDSIRVGGTATWYRRTSSIAGYGYSRWVYGLQAEVQP